MGEGFYWLVFGIVSFSMLFLITSSHISHAVPPSACDNRADGRIVSMKINSEGRTIDILSKQGTVIDATIQKGYTIKVVVEPLSSGPSPGKSSFWITNTAYGFSSGTCISKTIISLKGVEMGQAVGGLVQQVKWGSWPNTDQASYKVRWH